jgi:hypothetical protein
LEGYVRSRVDVMCLSLHGPYLQSLKHSTSAPQYKVSSRKTNMLETSDAYQSVLATQKERHGYRPYGRTSNNLNVNRLELPQTKFYSQITPSSLQCCCLRMDAHCSRTTKPVVSLFARIRKHGDSRQSRSATKVRKRKTCCSTHGILYVSSLRRAPLA